MDPLRATCTLKVKANSVKQEHEKQDELKRSALRAVAALLQIPKAGKFFSSVATPSLTSNKSLSIPDKNQALSEFLQLIKTSGDLQPLFESVQNASTGNSDINASGVTQAGSGQISGTGSGDHDSPRHMV